MTRGRRAILAHEALRVLHRQLGWPLAKIAERVGVSERTVYRWRHGRVPHLAALDRLWALAGRERARRVRGSK